MPHLRPTRQSREPRERRLLTEYVWFWPVRRSPRMAAFHGATDSNGSKAPVRPTSASGSLPSVADVQARDPEDRSWPNWDKAELLDTGTVSAPGCVNQELETVGAIRRVRWNCAQPCKGATVARTGTTATVRVESNGVERLNALPLIACANAWVCGRCPSPPSINGILPVRDRQWIAPEAL